jgi:hypothetical protein
MNELNTFFSPENNQEIITLGNLASGERVIVRSASHIHDNVALEKYLVQALGKIKSNNQNLIEDEVDFGEPIGNTICVSTDDNDEIIFARRPKRGGYTRFVKNRQSEPTSKLTVILTKDRQTNDYLILTTYFGPKAEPEPWDYKARGSALVFWRNHALVYGLEPIVEGTATREKKW